MTVVRVTATDNVGLARVVLKVGGSTVADRVISGTSWQSDFDLGVLPLGTVVTAQSFDQAGLESIPASVTVYGASPYETVSGEPFPRIGWEIRARGDLRLIPGGSQGNGPVQAADYLGQWYIRHAHIDIWEAFDELYHKTYGAGCQESYWGTEVSSSNTLRAYCEEYARRGITFDIYLKHLPYHCRTHNVPASHIPEHLRELARSIVAEIGHLPEWKGIDIDGEYSGWMAWWRGEASDGNYGSAFTALFPTGTAFRQFIWADPNGFMGTIWQSRPDIVGVPFPNAGTWDDLRPSDTPGTIASFTNHDSEWIYVGYNEIDLSLGILYVWQVDFMAGEVGIHCGLHHDRWGDYQTDWFGGSAPNVIMGGIHSRLAWIFDACPRQGLKLPHALIVHYAPWGAVCPLGDDNDWKDSFTRVLQHLSQWHKPVMIPEMGNTIEWAYAYWKAPGQLQRVMPWLPYSHSALSDAQHIWPGTILGRDPSQYAGYAPPLATAAEIAKWRNYESVDGPWEIWT